jgi:hypothetical protein
MASAVRRVLAELYRVMSEADAPLTNMIPEKDVRNQAIYHRYMAGERAVDLASEFGISVRRVNRIIRSYLNRRQM